MYVLPFSSPDATLPRVGGKGANLARLTRAGFAVPPGFFVTTDAYRAFVKACRLGKVIGKALAEMGESPDPAALEAASQTIRAAFVRAKPAPGSPEKQAQGIDNEILAAWRALSGGPVAVRSSATAEDLPNLSFAGQQDTWLNVVGAEAVLRVVVDCFGSLWTARAIGYRLRNGIPHEEVALAVVVQEMVESDTSGVLFTANPLTGRRGETVIDAIRGLGEALVSGQVEPDHYVVETATGLIRERTRGAKAVTIRPAAGGGVVRVEEATARDAWALPDATVGELTRLGRAVCAEYGGEPQDIEWAVAQGRLHLLQSRPITSLFPLPPGLPADPPALLFSFGAVQGLLEPLTPLGQEFLRVLSAAFSRLWGFDFEPGKVPAVYFVAERMWIRFDPLLRNKLTRTIWMHVFPIIEAGSGDEFLAVLNEPALIPTRPLPLPETWARLLPVVRSLAPCIVRALRDPDSARGETLALIDRILRDMQARTASAATLSERVQILRSALVPVTGLLPQLISPVVAAMGATFRLQGLADKAGVPREKFYEILRGMPHNVTTEMDLRLWQVSRTIGSDEDAWTLFQENDAPTLTALWRTRTLPPAAQQALDGFLAEYGARGVGEIDFGRTRWADNPDPLIHSVQNYLKVTDASMAPDLLFRRGEEAARVALDEVIAAITQKLGPRQGKLAAFLASRARALGGMREAPKFCFIRIIGILRAMMLDGFRQLAAEGLLETAQDGVWLRLDELLAIEAGYQIDWKALVRERKALWAREARRRQLPRVLMGDGRAFYGGAVAGPQGSAATQLQGTPVSPGALEGLVRVVFEPHRAHLEPGEILVCPGTDPAWTPLFMTAGGLVMEVGGLMTHGAVVAREYGIPAVVGVAHATSELRTGMRVRVDGSSGLVQILD